MKKCASQCESRIILLHSDNNIRRARREYGREALKPHLRGRSDEIDRRDTEAMIEGSEALGTAIGTLAIPLAIIYFLPVIGLYLAIGIGVIAWTTLMVWWPRTASVALACLTLAGLFYGVNSTGRFDLFWLEINPVISRSLPMWNGPGTWAMLAVAVGPLMFIIAAILMRMRLLPPPIIEEGWLERTATGISRYRIFSILAIPTAFLPLIVFVPVILWSGLFGDFGIMRGVELSRIETLKVIWDRPLEILDAGLHSGIFWPGGVGSSIGMIVVYICFGLSLIASLANCIVRRVEEKNARSG